jgi:hypothetical protein
MEKINKFCQSCGMPMEKDPEHGGTNKDGTRNSKYCSYCFSSGAFRDNFTTSDQMVSLVKDKLKEMGIGPLRRWFFSSNIPRLERWKN